MDEAFASERADASAGLRAWGGAALAAGGVLVVLGTLLHPSLETPTTIRALEGRLVAAHFLFTFSYLLILLGLPALYGAESLRMGRLGLVGFIVSFAGTTLLAVSGNFGFIAPVLAERAPEVIDAITFYGPVVAFNAMAAIGFMVGFVILGVAMSRAETLPRFSGVLVAVGAPMHLVGFALAHFVSAGLWFFAILGSVALGAGLGRPGYRMWQTRIIKATTAS
jgi:hypothetical protein